MRTVTVMLLRFLERFRLVKGSTNLYLEADYELLKFLEF